MAVAAVDDAWVRVIAVVVGVVDHVGGADRRRCEGWWVRSSSSSLAAPPVLCKRCYRCKGAAGVKTDKLTF